MKIMTRPMRIQYEDGVRICLGFVVGAIVVLNAWQHWLAILAGGVCGALAGTAVSIAIKLASQDRSRNSEEIMNDRNCTSEEVMNEKCIVKLTRFSRNQLYFILAISAASVFCGPYFLPFTSRTFDFAILGAIAGWAMCYAFEMMRNRYFGGSNSSNTQ